MKFAWRIFEALIKLSLLFAVLWDFWNDQISIKTVCVLLIILWSVLLDINQKKTTITIISNSKDFQVYEEEKEKG